MLKQHISQATSIASVLRLAFSPVVFDDVIIGIGFLAVLGATLFLYVTGKVVPNELYALAGVFIGYYVRNVVAVGKTPGTTTTITTSNNTPDTLPPQG
jgi:hypothetical protein